MSFNEPIPNSICKTLFGDARNVSNFKIHVCCLLEFMKHMRAFEYIDPNYYGSEMPCRCDRIIVQSAI